MTRETTRSWAITIHHQPESFEMFYRREYPHMVALARVMAPSRAVAEDLAQESFTVAHRHWDRVARYDDPRAWVRRVMINRAMSVRRRIAAEMRALLRAGHDPYRGVSQDLTPATTEIWEEVRRLPRRQQQAIVLHYVGQLSTEEIGAAMGCSAGAVKTHL
ncbi:MAG: sigma-70 family RNA polymerase sigma factor, partial [Actinobacteria bacterium]|nr:sigma-70 family RNA polymerase sigma factor [Actinomycetota bacterium]